MRGAWIDVALGVAIGLIVAVVIAIGQCRHAQVTASPTVTGTP